MHVIASSVRHRVLLHHTKVDGTEAGAHCEVLATLTVSAGGQSLTFFEIDLVDRCGLERVNRNDLDVAILMADHSVLLILRIGCGSDESHWAEGILWPCVDVVEHA